MRSTVRWSGLIELKKLVRENMALPAPSVAMSAVDGDTGYCDDHGGEVGSSALVIDASEAKTEQRAVVSEIMEILRHAASTGALPGYSEITKTDSGRADSYWTWEIKRALVAISRSMSQIRPLRQSEHPSPIKP